MSSPLKKFKAKIFTLVCTFPRENEQSMTFGMNFYVVCHGCVRVQGGFVILFINPENRKTEEDLEE